MANYLTHTVKLGWSAPGGAAISKEVNVTGHSEVNISATLTASTTNAQYTFAFTKAKLQMFMITSTGAISFRTNTTTGADSFTMVANQPYIWYTGSGLANPFAGDVTTAYITNALTVAADIDIKALVTDP